MKSNFSNADLGRPMGLAAAFLLLLTGGCKESPWLVKEHPADAMYDLRGSGISKSELPNMSSDPKLGRQSALATKK